MIIQLDMVQSISLAVILLLLGEFLVKKINFLSKYCIPAPVVGGLLFSISALILKQNNIMEFVMDDTLQTLTMTIFFTSVGFSASFELLKNGGIKVFLFLGITILLVIIQNVVSIGLTYIFDLNPLLGIAIGSVPMTGGHGTAAAFGPEIVKKGIVGADTVAIASATFGLVAGGIIGGPIGKQLIENNNLLDKKSNKKTYNFELNVVDKTNGNLIPNNFYIATFELLIAMGLGTIISALLKKTGLTFPSYIGAMLAGALVRNISDFTNLYDVPTTEINILGEISLSLFLSMALMSLKLWELISLAIPMILILLTQTFVMYLFAKYVTFNVMGKDYDAAVLAAGHCGFGLGATPNGIANMNSIVNKFGPAPIAFFILPLVGSLFIDFFNTVIITITLNLLN
ncbi:ESS family glutamate:Na+ symporter [Keratinibaculum paraultunense]|uniref:Sodium/glutamate symporter n=1 Tax=Keratinibaculum paraultunense TaxID=1278232 RepID=A0A4R3KWM3_9FIRM|nr:sodium/glutamate symporter [Keratinibaculum paraultunense]QQY78779.1 sodium/glutamate symporter [Keratinibaculum paraultunense]TCS89536.1 ESS family glutamate:Na+ symporter [Keratinibaculum paraultunense]